MTSSTGGNISIRLYDMFRNLFKLNESEAREGSLEMGEILKEQSATMIEHKIDIIHKDFEILRNEIQAFKVDVDRRFEFTATKEDVSKSREEIIRWMFVFWIGQLGATIAIIFLFLKK